MGESQRPDSTQNATVEPILLSASALDAMKIQMVREVAPRRWHAPLIAIQQRLEGGDAFEDALRAVSGSMPTELRSLCQQALETPDPCGLLIELASTAHQQRAAWREFWGTISYSLSLLYFAIGTALLFSQTIAATVGLDWLGDLGVSGVDMLLQTAQQRTATTWGLAGLAAWSLVAGAMICYVGPPGTKLAVLSGIAFLGRPLRYQALWGMLRRLELFLGVQSDGQKAIDLWARSLKGSELEWAGHHVARRIASGMRFGDALAESMYADRVTSPILRSFNSQGGDMVARLRDVEGLLERLRLMELRNLRQMFPPILVLLVVAIIWGVLLDYVSTLILFLQVISQLASIEWFCI